MANGFQPTVPTKDRSTHLWRQRHAAGGPFGFARIVDGAVVGIRSLVRVEIIYDHGLRHRTGGPRPIAMITTFTP